MISKSISKHARCQIVPEVERGSDGNLLPVELFRKSYPTPQKNSLLRPGSGMFCYTMIKQALCNWKHAKCKSTIKIKQ